jgi:hypothetical protein
MTFQRLQYVTFTISCLLTWIILFFIISAYLILNKFSLTLVDILSTCTYTVCMYVCTRFDAVPYKYFLVCWWIQRNRCSVFTRIRRHISIKIIIANYSPMIYSAPCIMFWMCAYPLGGPSGSRLGPGNWEFFGPLKWHPHLGLKNSRFPEPNPIPSNGYACIQIIMHRAV